MIDKSTILTLTEIVQLPAPSRQEAIQNSFGQKSQAELLDLIGNVLNVAINYAQSCDETVELHLLCHSDMHPERFNFNAPSFHGALNGLILAQKAPNQEILCKSCAYRSGTLANHSLSTQTDLAYAIGEEAIFYCHQEIENLSCPSAEDRQRMKPCKGWAQHVKNRDIA